MQVEAPTRSPCSYRSTITKQRFIAKHQQCLPDSPDSERTRWLVQDIIGSDQLKEEIKERRYQSLPKRKGSMVKPLLRTTERPVRKRGDEPMK